jgi:hypothetical protein
MVSCSNLFSLVFKEALVTNAVVAEDNQSQCDGTAGSNVSTDVFNRSQPEKHNMNERLITLPDEQVSDAGAASATISSVDADGHDSHAPQPSSQGGPEYSRSLSPPSPKASNSVTGLIGDRGENSTLAESTRHSSPPGKSV